MRLVSKGVALCLLSACVAACSEQFSGPNGKEVPTECFYADVSDSSEVVDLMTLTPTALVETSNNCALLFETVSSVRRGDEIGIIQIVMIYRPFDALESEIRRCQAIDDKDFYYFKRELSKVIRSCSDSQIYSEVREARSLLDPEVVGSFIPSNYFNEDPSLGYLPPSDNFREPMVAGIIENEAIGMVPVCVIPTGAPMPMGGFRPSRSSGQLLNDDLSTCLFRFLHLN